MNQSTYIYLWAILLSLSMMSCEHDFELDVPRATKNVVLSSLAPDSLLKVYVSSTVPVGDAASESLKNPTDARVALTADGTFVGDLTYRENDHGQQSYYYLPGMKVQSGVLYEVEVEVKGKPISTAKNIVPKRLAEVDVQLMSLEEVSDPNFLDAVDVTAIVRVDITDTSSDGFYYHVKGSAYQAPLNGLTVVNKIDHLSILHEEGTLVRLSDSNTALDFIDLEVKFYYFPDFEDREPFKLEIRKCSKDYYLFHRSVGEQEISNFRDGILSSQSIQIHNNIKGGVGNFSSYVSHRRTVVW